MQITIDKKKFQKALTYVESVISIREIRSTLSNFLLEAVGDTLKITASDLEIVLSTSVDAVITKEGSITVPARKFTQVVNEMQNDKILLTANDDFSIKINVVSEHSNAEIKLMGTSADEYPKMSEIPLDNYTKIPIALLLEMFNLTSYSMAKEDARHVFNGLYVISDGKKVTCVTTDGRRLATVENDFEEFTPLNEGVIIPFKTIKEIERIGDTEKDCYIAYSETDKRIFFNLGNVHLSSKLIDGRFPDYKQVIPDTTGHDLILKKDLFEKVTRQVAVMAAEPSRQIRYTFHKNQLMVDASTPDLGEANDSIPIEYEGEDMTIALNSKYVMDVLRVIQTEEIILGITSANSSTVMRKPNDTNFTAVIMPMKL